MSAITGLMYGTQYYQGNDAPRYKNGLSIQIGVVAAGLVLVGVQEVIYYFHNKKIRQESQDEGDGGKLAKLHIM